MRSATRVVDILRADSCHIRWYIMESRLTEGKEGRLRFDQRLQITLIIRCATINLMVAKSIFQHHGWKLDEITQRTIN